MEVYEYNTEASQSIVFLHGANTGAYMWRAVIEKLTDFHCIAVDFPGHGKSNAELWESFDKTANDVADLIKTKAKNGVANVVGLSLGGYIAFHLMKVAPAHINRAIISGVQLAQFQMHG